MKGTRSKMYKFIIIAISIGGVVFSRTWDNTTKTVVNSNLVINEFFMAADIGDENYKLERKRGGRDNRKRRRGGSGLR